MVAPTRAFAFGVLVLMGVVGVIAVPDDAAAAGTGPGRLREPFRHRPHVPDIWMVADRPETARDCRGCHAYGDPPHDPAAVCQACHYDQDLDFGAAGLQNTLVARRDDTNPFTHQEHLKVDCRECHRDADARAAVVPDHMPIPVGAGLCVRCHDPVSAGKRPEAVTDEKLKVFLAGLNRSPRMGPGPGFGPFKHLEHIKSTQIDGRDQSQCGRCHGQISETDARGLAHAEYAKKSCNACHVGSQAAIDFIDTPKPVRSDAALCFSHADHLAAGKGLKNADINTKSCYACHTWNAAAGTFDQAGFTKYASCVRCHEHESWKVDQHGEVDNCGGCHTIGTGKMKENRRTVSVSRLSSVRFRISEQKHPMIAGVAPTGDCAECHRAKVAVLPSRIVDKPFSHATHVSTRETGVGACNACHGAVAATDGSAAIGRTWTPEACATCHLGSQPEPVAQPDCRPASRVVDFPHARHVGKKFDGATMECQTCHGTPASPGNASVSTLPAAADCTQCHSHEKHPEITGSTKTVRADGAYVTSCVRCHTVGVPRKGEPVMTERTTITDIKPGEAQFHPVQPPCITCHQVSPDGFASPSDAAPLAATRRFARQMHSGRPGAQTPPGDCTRCHWDQVGNETYWQGLNPRPKSIFALRADLGGKLAGFPGGKDGPR